jgi:hypothetical protein
MVDGGGNVLELAIATHSDNVALLAGSYGDDGALESTRREPGERFVAQGARLGGRTNDRDRRRMED